MTKILPAHKLITNYPSLTEYITETAPLKDFVESVTLVSSSIFGLFSSKGITEVAKEALAVGTTTDVSKNILSSLYKKLDCNQFLEYLQNADSEKFASISPDFFNTVSKHFARSQSIENYARIMFHLFKIYGYYNTFIRNFFGINRDEKETNLLIKYVSTWDFDSLKISKNLVITKIYIASIDRMTTSGNHQSIIPLLSDYLLLVSFNKCPESILNLNKLAFVTVSSVAAKKDLSKLRAILEIMLKPEHELALITLNRILDTINKNLLNEHLVELIFHSITVNGLKPNLISYNCYVESHSKLGNMNRIYEIFELLKQAELEPDSYTFSNMIKGLKTVPSFDAFMHHQKIYKLLMSVNCKDQISINSFIDQCVITNDDEMAMTVFNSVLQNKIGTQPDNVTYNIMMKLAIKNKNISMAKSLLHDLLTKNFKPKLSTFNSLLNMTVKMNLTADLLYFFECLKKTDILPDSFTYSILLNGAKTLRFDLKLIQQILDDIKVTLIEQTQKIDEVVFNSILEILFTYDLIDQFDFFHIEMKRQKIPESSYTFSVLLKKLSKSEDFEKISQVFDEILEKKILISDFNYGFILDYYAKSKQMDHAYVIFEKLRKSNIELSSIIFTTMIKGFINAGDHKTALIVFNDIKHLVQQPGMIITYNCVLDLLIIDSKIEEGMALFNEIDQKFKVDLISYSTFVKGLCKVNQRTKALELINRMIDSKIEYDVSIINLFLESCASGDDMKLGMNTFENLVKKNVTLNDITMGIMAKIYGANFKLKQAFDLLEYIAKNNMRPSLIFFTNLIHVSFFNKKPAKAELVATLMAREDIKGDKLMFSKLIEGLLRFKQTQNIAVYIQQAIDDQTTLKKELIVQLFDIYEDEPEMCYLIERVKHSEKNKVSTEDASKKIKNNYHQTNTINFKNQIWQKNREKQEIEKKEQLAKERACRNVENPERKVFGGNTKKEGLIDPNQSKQSEYLKNSTGVIRPRQPMVLHNFRTNKKPE